MPRNLDILLIPYFFSFVLPNSTASGKPAIVGSNVRFTLAMIQSKNIPGHYSIS
jgi:hypothetical protein